MLIEIDFNSDEAIYVQLCNQIIMGIDTEQLNASFCKTAGRYHRN